MMNTLIIILDTDTSAHAIRAVLFQGEEGLSIKGCQGAVHKHDTKLPGGRGGGGCQLQWLLSPYHHSWCILTCQYLIFLSSEEAIWLQLHLLVCYVSANSNTFHYSYYPATIIIIHLGILSLLMLLLPQRTVLLFI